ncbi:Radical SAM domain protein [Natranaerobius thermophilus JW/NM-WN-LF]|uniref:Radical SAM domain protein n=2 Tax=Natranaerobius TaxID=375928 RepID=B2A8C3_NATTJ|nr:Radical SAM domain protein [Natranaerobius thermophilus JW/NM-WN-LF]
MHMERRKFLSKTGKILGLSSTLSALLLQGCDMFPWSEDTDPLKGDGTDTGLDITNDIKDLKEAMFYKSLNENRVKCQVCFRECVIKPSERGFCRNRENKEGKLYNIVYGRPSAVQIDPVEKEPQHHFMPGSYIFCVGTAGCNYRCKYCHNYQLSQQSIDDLRYEKLLPEDLVEQALEQNVAAISFTYNEPTSLYEYMYDTAKLAQEHEIGVMFHSNGSMSTEPLKKLLKYVDSTTIDLKGFEDNFYQDISQAELSPVLDTLKTIVDAGVWLEIVNLMVTDLNDDPEVVKDMCTWIKEELGEDIPLHFTRFTPSYKMTDTSPTPVERLEKAREIAIDCGLRFVTIGNVPGHQYNSTYCPECHQSLIKRDHFSVHEINLEDGKCENCGLDIPGVWSI